MTSKTMLRHFMTVAFASTLFATTSFGQPQPPPQPPTDPRSSPPSQTEPKKTGAKDEAAKAGPDARFVQQAAEGGMLEVAKGRLAAQKGAHDGVKQFGQKMVDDHSKANDELKSIAKGKNITLPAEPSKHPALAKLEKLEGAAFDRAYVDDQVRDHQKTVALFERQAKNGKDPELKAFAEKTLPTLKQHMTMVQDLKTQISKRGTN